MFLQQEVRAFENNIGQELQKSRPKFKNMYTIYFCQQFNTSGSFLQTCISFVGKRLKFSHFEGSMIP